MTSENDELVQLDDVLTQLRANGKAMARDMISGVEMTGFVSRLMFYIALLGLALAFVDLVTVPLAQGGKCCYTITYSDLIGGIAGLVLVGLAAWQGLRIRAKYRVLHVRYDKLLEIESAPHTLGIFWIQARNFTNFDLKFGNEIIGAGWRTVNYDSGFDNLETAWCNHNGCPWSMTVDNFSYWVPSVGGNQTGCPQTDYGSTFINASVLHTRERNVDSTSSCFDTSIASEGNFPWMSTQRGCVGTSQKYVPVFTCPRNSYGEHEVAHSDFTYTNVSAHVTFNSRNSPTNPAHYAILLDLYWWLNGGNVTAQGKTYAWMETAIRVASTTYSAGCSCWQDDPIGFNGTFDAGTNFAFHMVVAQVHPGDPTYYLSAFNATRLYQQALAAWSIPASTHGVLIGIQVGTEGYGSVLSVDFSDMTIGTHMPDAAAADTNFDHIINGLDTADEANSFGECPNNHSTSPQAYKWTVDVTADSCNNILDSAYIAYYYGLSY